MPRARTIRGRLRQVERWLAADYPAIFPVRIRVERIADGCAGMTERSGALFVIRLNRYLLNTDETVAAEVLLHEHAHCLCWQPQMEGEPHWQDHDAAFGVQYAKLYAAYFDDGGAVDSCEFSARPWS